MSDPQTPNKQFNIPIRGSDVGVWDTSLNANFNSMDSLLGAGYSISLSSTNVTLTESEANNLYFNLTGALLADVEVIFPAIGGIFIINNQTTGNFTVSINTVSVGASVNVQQGAATIVYLDGTNVFFAAPSNSSAFVGSSFTAPDFYALGAAGSARSIFFQSTVTGVPSSRWEFRCDATAESGSNAGSNLDIYAYADDGSTSTLVATVNRASGIWNFSSEPTVAGVGVRPSGEIASFGMSTAPAGWLVCNGAAVSRSTYAALFAAIGTVWGTGDGSTTFNLPNAQGYFLRGWNSTGSGVDPSRVFASVQADTNGPITGTVTLNSVAGFSGGSNSYGSGGTGGNGGATWACTNAGTETRPKNIAVLVCIKT